MRDTCDLIASMVEVIELESICRLLVWLNHQKNNSLINSFINYQ